MPIRVDHSAKDKSVYFKNGLFEYFDFINSEFKRLRPGIIQKTVDYRLNNLYLMDKINRLGTEWFGSNDLQSVKDIKTTFLFTEKIEALMSHFKRKVDTVDVTALNQKKRIMFNDRDLGIFSFDLASLGLIRVMEYYSPYLKRIVSGNYVKSKKVDGKLQFYHVPVERVPEHKLKEKGAELYSPILKINVERSKARAASDSEGNIVFLYPEREAIAEHLVEQRQVKLPDGRPKFSSTWKKSFIFIEKNPYNLPQIDIIIGASFSWEVKADQEMLYNILPSMALMQTLEKAGVKFRVFFLNSFYQTQGQYITSPGEYNNQFIKLKDVNDPIDYNTISICTADGRFLRYETFKGIASISNYLNTPENYFSKGFGFPKNDTDRLLKDFNQIIRESKDYGSGDPDMYKGDYDKNKLIFPSVLSEQDAFELYEKQVDKIKGMLKL